MRSLKRRISGRIGYVARDDRGVTAVEYSLMAGLIAVVIVGAVTALGLSVNGLFASINSYTFW